MPSYKPPCIGKFIEAKVLKIGGALHEIWQKQGRWYIKIWKTAWNKELAKNKTCVRLTIPKHMNVHLFLIYQGRSILSPWDALIGNYKANTGKSLEFTDFLTFETWDASYTGSMIPKWTCYIPLWPPCNEHYTEKTILRKKRTIFKLLLKNLPISFLNLRKPAGPEVWLLQTSNICMKSNIYSKRTDERILNM